MPPARAFRFTSCSLLSLSHFDGWTSHFIYAEDLGFDPQNDFNLAEFILNDVSSIEYDVQHIKEHNKKVSE